MTGRASVVKIFLILGVILLLLIAMSATGISGQARVACTQNAWYFAEGFTGGDFDTWILAQNPNQQDTIVHLKFMTPQGEPVLMDLPMTGETRRTVYLNSIPELANQEVATVATCDTGGIVVERAMYFNYTEGDQVRAGGHATIGSPEARNYWWLPEGCTRGSFNTYVLLLNPNAEPASVELKLMLPEGGRYYRFHLDVPAESRRSVLLNDLVWTEGADNVLPASVNAATGENPVPQDPVTVSFDETDVSAWILSDKPIVAEHSLYYDYYGKAGGSSSMGSPVKSNTWFLPEGYTGGDFDTYVLVQNPNGTEANVNFSFYTNPEQAAVATYPVPPVGEGLVTYSATVGPWARFTLWLDEVPGLSGTDVATRVDADQQVVAERSMYFTYGATDDGHLSLGTTTPYPYWHLAEGYTGGAFDTYVLIVNPFDYAQKVTATFMTPEGDPVVLEYEVAAYSRFTIHVDEIPGLEDVDVSTLLRADKIEAGAAMEPAPASGGIVAERSMYFVYDGKQGGSCSIGFGVPTP